MAKQCGSWSTALMAEQYRLMVDVFTFSGLLKHGDKNCGYVDNLFGLKEDLCEYSGPYLCEE